jgi:hypothetical protein
MAGRADQLEPLMAYRGALRTGVLPPHIEPDLWRGWLRRSRRLFAPELLWPCYLVAVGLSAILVHQSVYRWAIAALFELSATLILFRWWASRQRLVQLEAEVHEYEVREMWG